MEKIKFHPTDAQPMVDASLSPQKRKDEERYMAWTGLEAGEALSRYRKQTIKDFGNYLQQRPANEDEIVSSVPSEEEYQAESGLDQELNILQDFFAESDDSEHLGAALELLNEFAEKNNLDAKQKDALEGYLLGLTDKISNATHEIDLKPEPSDGESDKTSAELPKALYGEGYEFGYKGKKCVIVAVLENANNPTYVIAVDFGDKEHVSIISRSEAELANMVIEGSPQDEKVHNVQPEDGETINNVRKYAEGDVVKINDEEWTILDVVTEPDGSISYTVDNGTLLETYSEEELKNVIKSEHANPVAEDVEHKTIYQTEGDIEAPTAETDFMARAKAMFQKIQSKPLGVWVKFQNRNIGTAEIDKSNERRKKAIVAVGVLAVAVAAGYLTYKYGINHGNKTHVINNGLDQINPGGNKANLASHGLDQIHSGGVDPSSGGAGIDPSHVKTPEVSQTTVEHLNHAGDTVWAHAKDHLQKVNKITHPTAAQIQGYAQRILDANPKIGGWEGAKHMAYKGAKVIRFIMPS